MPAFGLIPDSPWIYYGQKLGKSLKVKAGRSFSRGMTWTVQNVKIYDMVLWQVLKGQSKGGLVANQLRIIGSYVVANGKTRVGKRYGKGTLASSIKMEPLTVHGYGMKLRVTAKNKVAYMHHEGTKSHIITPKEPDGVLVFRKGTRLIKTRMVNHPGTKPNPYLRRPMEEAINIFAGPGPL